MARSKRRRESPPDAAARGRCSSGPWSARFASTDSSDGAPRARSTSPRTGLRPARSRSSSCSTISSAAQDSPARPSSSRASSIRRSHGSTRPERSPFDYMKCATSLFISCVDVGG
ncbi:MAG: hypothetical protein ACK56F_00800, partial [bacterium]